MNGQMQAKHMKNLKKTHARFKKAAVYLAIAGGCFIALSNIIASQVFPNLFYPFVDGSRQSVVSYLTHIKKLPIFETELARYKNTYGATIETEVFKEDVLRKQKISFLEKELVKQPYARDILYALSLLYRDDGNTDKAVYYLEKARAIDPSIRN